MANKENEESLLNLDTDVFVINAEDKENDKDLETGTCLLSTTDNLSLIQTANLPTLLKICIGARVMLTYNIDVSEKLINGSIETVKHLQISRSKSISSQMFAGNNLKDG